MKKFFAGVMLIFAAAYVLTQPAVFESQSLVVDDSWTDEGVVDNLESNGMIYPEPDENGTWTSDVQEVGQTKEIDFTAEGNPSDGDVFITFLLYEGDVNGDPDAEEEFEMDDSTFSDTVENESVGLEDFDAFEVEIEMEETRGSNNDAPNVESFEAYWDSTDSVLSGFDGIIYLMLLLMLVWGAYAVTS